MNETTKIGKGKIMNLESDRFIMRGVPVHARVLRRMRLRIVNYGKILSWMLGLWVAYIFLIFVLVNIIADCKSWNPDFWTQESFCVTPAQIFKYHF